MLPSSLKLAPRVPKRKADTVAGIDKFSKRGVDKKVSSVCKRPKQLDKELSPVRKQQAATHCVAVVLLPGVDAVTGKDVVSVLFTCRSVAKEEGTYVKLTTKEKELAIVAVDFPNTSPSTQWEPQGGGGGVL